MSVCVIETSCWRLEACACHIGGACARSARRCTFVASVFSFFLRCLTRPLMLFIVSSEMLC